MIKNVDAEYLVFGYEVGENGTPHLQGFVYFRSNKRLAAVKDLLGARVHIEYARGSNQQAADYCKKDGNVFEKGTLPGSQGKRSDWDRYREWVEDLGRRPTKVEVCLEWPSLYARYKTACFEIAEAIVGQPRLTTTAPREGWQAELAEEVTRTPDPREIHFYVDPHGNSGKTWMCQWLLTEHERRTQVIRIGKRDDLAHCIDPDKDIFCFDVPRTQMEYLQYSILESLKDRLVFSPKYDSTMKILQKTPHVIVFSNELPDMNKLSLDRFNITNI